MKKAVKTQVLKWHEAGISIDEFAPVIPQYCRQEIEAVIKEYEEAKTRCRLMNGLRY